MNDLFGNPIVQPAAIKLPALIDMGTYSGLDKNLFEQVGFKGFGPNRVSQPKAISHVDRKFIKARYASELVKQIGEVQKESFRRCILSGAFVYSDFIKSFIIENDYHVKSMSICTLSLNPGCVDNLAYLINEGWVDELNLIVGARWYNDEFHNTVKKMYADLDIENRVQIAVASTHMKDVIFETIGGKFINMEGSANLRTSQCNEKLIISEDEEGYRWNYEVMQGVIKGFGTINKEVPKDEECIPLRNKPLWVSVAESGNDEVLTNLNDYTVNNKSEIIKKKHK